MRVEFGPRIVADSEISFGKPTIKGAHVPGELVVGNLGCGLSIEDIMDEYVLEHAIVLATSVASDTAGGGGPTMLLH